MLQADRYRTMVTNLMASFLNVLRNTPERRAHMTENKSGKVFLNSDYMSTCSILQFRSLQFYIPDPFSYAFTPHRLHCIIDIAD
jgi:hypothetical protein